MISELFVVDDFSGNGTLLIVGSDTGDRKLNNLSNVSQSILYYRRNFSSTCRPMLIMFFTVLLLKVTEDTGVEAVPDLNRLVLSKLDITKLDKVRSY